MSKLNKIEIERLKEVAAKVKSSSQAARELGLFDGGGTLTRLRKLISENEIDISHWTGQAWSKGSTSLEDERIKSSVQKQGEPFCENSTTNPSYVKSLIIKKKLLPYKCSLCDMGPVWNGKELKFQLDHINGIRTDHRLENLRMVCPNCHSQTETYCAKNKKRTFPSRQKIIDAAKETYSITETIRVLGINNVNYEKIENIIKEENITQKKKLLTVRNCKSCGSQIMSRAKLYCSNSCNPRTSVPEKDWPHGTYSTYKYRNCRCQPCTKANTDSKRRLRQNKKV
jgi:hypothetical protein